MFLLIHKNVSTSVLFPFPLNSIMFLLILIQEPQRKEVQATLNSIMFLLIPHSLDHPTNS